MSAPACPHRSIAFYPTRLPQHVRCLDCLAVGVYDDANVIQWKPTER